MDSVIWKSSMTEIILSSNDLIVSKTDPKGRITYCNEIFMEISEFGESELLGQAHNIVRHPDMPRAVYRLMWQTLQNGEEFLGIIKNRCKSNKFYWTYANVTPSYNEHNNLIGYYSVRRKPNLEFVKKIEKIYKSMTEIEAASSSSNIAMEASIELLNQEITKTGMSYDQYIYTNAQ